jgi:translation initiation factor IF-3
MGIYLTSEAVKKAEEMGLDLVEISPKADPPVCKIIDYGKFCYQQTKRDKDQKKGSTQGKVKEVKFKPNIDTHDLDVKINRAKGFLEKGHKVKFTCMFRGREIVFVENGKRVMDKIIEALQDVATPDAGSKMMGRMLTMLVNPGAKEKRIKIQKTKTEESKEES